MEKQVKPFSGQTLERFIEAEIRAKSDDSRTVELSFSSEVAVERWYGAEILAHDDGSVNLQRLLDVGVVLFSHGRDVKFGKMPVAKIEKAWLDTATRKCRAEITFDDDEDSDKVYQKVKKGYIKGVSFGYAVNNWEEVLAGKKSTNGRYTGPAYIALNWEPFEISIEPTPADPAVGVGRAQPTENQEAKPAGTCPAKATDARVIIEKRRLELKTKF